MRHFFSIGLRITLRDGQLLKSNSSTCSTEATFAINSTLLQVRQAESRSEYAITVQEQAYHNRNRLTLEIGCLDELKMNEKSAVK